MINDVPTPLARVGLLIDPLTPDLAGEIDAEVKDHCFRHGKIRKEIAHHEFKLEPTSMTLIGKMAADSPEPSCVLQGVVIKAVTIARLVRTPPGSTKGKAKRVDKPDTLRAVLKAVMDLRDDVVRNTVARFFKQALLFTFQIEAERLPLDVAPPKPDAAAGDVLDDQRSLELGRRRRPVTKPGGPKLVRKKGEKDPPADAKDTTH